MNELAHLRSMWKPRFRRRLDLIVPEVTFTEGRGSLNNEHWKYDVGYAFRSALDIRFDERVRKKRKYWVWTQGPVIYFRDGDSIHSRDGAQCLSVLYAHPMGWDKLKGEMYQGNVEYQRFEIRQHCYHKTGRHSCTQMEFLQLLISGITDPE